MVLSTSHDADTNAMLSHDTQYQGQWHHVVPMLMFGIT